MERRARKGLTGSRCFIMRCPRCYSLNVRRSRRRLWERGVTLLLPTTPHRCRSCRGRFWRRTGALLSLPRILALGGLTALTALFAIRTLGLLQPPPEPAPAPRAVPAPALALPSAKPSVSPLPKPETERDGLSSPEDAKPESAKAADLSSLEEELGLAEGGSGSVGAPPSAVSGSVAAKERKTPSVTPSGQRAGASRLDSRGAGQTLTAIRGETHGGLLKLLILSGEPIEDFRSFTLEDPRRIVLDLPGSWQVKAPTVVELGHHLASRVRIGRHEDKLRLVIDAAIDTGQQPRIEPFPQGLMVHLSPISLRPLPL